MSARTDIEAVGASHPSAPVPGMTPAGIQSTAVLRRRRLIVAALNVATWIALLVAGAAVFGSSGWSPVDVGLLVCLVFATPWTVLGFWNAIIGLALLHAPRLVGAGNGLAAVAPFALGDTDAPIGLSTAILMTVRNEDPGRAIARLAAIKASLDATPDGDRFAYFVLSDTSSAEIAKAEEAAVEAWRAGAADPLRIVYRRRTSNEGFKAGNLRDFCQRWGEAFELMIPLDADSLMTGEAILQLVRIMEAHPRLGILQSLIVGLPSRSAFARIFQFGMRHGMRSYTMGSAWWAGDCGPFWGHNAAVRIAPFRDHCDLPLLPGGKRILSHDQVEAVLMRRAGYEVRVLPVETGSYEENPPTQVEFARRDLRWCQGNMQYWALLALPRLLPMSRFQLAWAILMFLGAPAFTAMILLAALKPFDGEPLAAFPAAGAAALYVGFLVMSLAPKLAGLVDIALRPGGVAAYGGVGRFLLGAVTEIAFAFLIGAVSTFKVTIFLLGLPFGRGIGWGSQARDARSVGWGEAARMLWPELLFGLVVAALFLAGAQQAFLWSLPLTAGYLVAIPFAVLTASPRFGALLARWRLCAVPEDFVLPADLRPVLATVPGQGIAPAAATAA